MSCIHYLGYTAYINCSVGFPHLSEPQPRGYHVCADIRGRMEAHDDDVHDQLPCRTTFAISGSRGLPDMRMRSTHIPKTPPAGVAQLVGKGAAYRTSSIAVLKSSGGGAAPSRLACSTCIPSNGQHTPLRSPHPPALPLMCFSVQGGEGTSSPGAGWSSQDGAVARRWRGG